MKQYLETATNSANQANSSEAEELPKGLAKSLLAKWKSMENVKDKETSPESGNDGSKKSERTRAFSKDRQTSPGASSGNESSNGEDYMPQSGTAKMLLSKWKNIDSNASSNKERKGPRPITPPPADELERAKVLI